MNTLAEQQAYFQQSAHRFVRYFLLQAGDWGARSRGLDAPTYLAILQEAFPNIQLVLVRTVGYLEADSLDDGLWNLWRDAVLRVFNFYDYRGLWEEMYDLLSRGIHWAQHCNDMQTVAIFLFYQARLDSQQGRSEQALAKSEESLQIFTALQEEGWKANLLHFRGMLLRRQDPQAARQSFEMALDVWERLNERGGRAATFYEIGRLEEEKGNAATAEQLYWEALTIFQELGLPREQATLLFQLGELLADTKLLETALQLYRSLMDERGYAQTLHQLGRIWHKRGNHDQARALYLEAIRIFDRLGARQSIRSVERDRLKLNEQ